MKQSLPDSSRTRFASILHRTRVFLLLGAVCALLAYYPTPFLQHILELES